MMFQAGDLGLTIDYGISRTGSILQRKTNREWQDYLVEGEPVVDSFDVETLPPEQYQLWEKLKPQPSLAGAVCSVCRSPCRATPLKCAIVKLANRIPREGSKGVCD